MGMARQNTDILISGAGIAGMILAALLAKRGFHVMLVDPSPPARNIKEDSSDLRSTAYLAPSRDVLEAAGLWDTLAPHAVALNALRVVDSTGWPPRMIDSRTFLPADLGRDSFGWNIPNWRARKVLSDTLRQTDGVDLRLGVEFTDMLARDKECLVRLSDGSTVRAALVVGADGRASAVRVAARIDARTRRYGQKALAFAVTHTQPHRNISTEIYNSGGAFTTVPLPDVEDQPASAIVWMNDGRRAVDLVGADAGPFHAQLNLRSLGMLGEMQLTSPLRSWPIVTQTVARLTAKRCVLIAEAAHVLPPIGAQGLNTSITDIAVLAKHLTTSDPGNAANLRAYEQARTRDIRLRAGVIDLFNRVCQSDGAAIQKFRRLGLQTVHDIPPLRQRVMEAGLGNPQKT